MKLERRKTGRRRRSYFRDSMVNLDEWRWEGGWRVAGGVRRGSGFHLCCECMKDGQEREGGGEVRKKGGRGGEGDEEEEWDV